MDIQEYSKILISYITKVYTITDKIYHSVKILSTKNLHKSTTNFDSKNTKILLAQVICYNAEKNRSPD